MRQSRQVGKIKMSNEMCRFASPVLESRYLMSEHVVRLLAVGKISVREIETVLLTGSVLEEHRNPMRVPCYLTYGESDGKPVHVVCTDGLNNRLVILFAYVPTMPIWASPTRRSGLGGITMTEPVGTCFFCGGKMVEIIVGNYYYRHEGRMCVVKNLPATLCQQCGEKYIQADVGKKLNALIDGEKYSGTEEANVINYQSEMDVS
jgi:YgiT-type zinc finger domain-containing protein